MLQLIGLTHLSNKELALLAFVGVCCCFAVGWIMDLVMEKAGFGIFGNSMIAVFAVLVGLYAYSNHYGTLARPNLTMVMAFLVASVMLHLLVLAIVRRVLRL